MQHLDKQNHVVAFYMGTRLHYINALLLLPTFCLINLDRDALSLMGLYPAQTGLQMLEVTCRLVSAHLVLVGVPQGLAIKQRQVVDPALQIADGLDTFVVLVEVPQDSQIRVRELGEIVYLVFQHLSLPNSLHLTVFDALDIQSGVDTAAVFELGSGFVGEGDDQVLHLSPFDLTILKN